MEVGSSTEGGPGEKGKVMDISQEQIMFWLMCAVVGIGGGIMAAGIDTAQPTLALLGGIIAGWFGYFAFQAWQEL